MGDYFAAVLTELLKSGHEHTPRIHIEKNATCRMVSAAPTYFIYVIAGQLVGWEAPSLILDATAAVLLSAWVLDDSVGAAASNVKTRG